MARAVTGLFCLLILLSLWGCTPAGTDVPLASSQEPRPEAPTPEEPGLASTSKGAASAPEDFTPYKAPPFAGAAFNADAAQGEAGVLVDTSSAALGYVGVSAQSDKRLKAQVMLGESTYNYDLDPTGVPAILPLQGGDGLYTVRVLENAAGDKYAPLYTEEVQVALEDEFQPFLRPSQMVPYGEGSACVKKAQELSAKQPDALGVVDAVFEFICDNVTYDTELAKTVKSGYLPDPDATLDTGEGICFDYAALAAAMLRSQGIPTKMVFGYVQPDDLYHAWNMFYTQESGWVTVEYQVSSNTWNRLDPTFSAGGSDAAFVGDGTNYTDVYYY